MLVSRTLRTATVLFAVTILAPVAHADPTADARKAMQTVYDKVAAAMAKKDMNGVMAYFTPDFQQIGPDGRKATLAEMKQMIQMQMQMMQNPKMKTTIQKFSLKGKEAKATVKQHFAASIVNPQTSKVIKVASDETSDDTWVKTARGWQLRKSVTLTSRQTADGKPIKAGG
jgi:ketosteroid isomerase-like protein